MFVFSSNAHFHKYLQYFLIPNFSNIVFFFKGADAHDHLVNELFLFDFFHFSNPFEFGLSDCVTSADFCGDGLDHGKFFAGELNIHTIERKGIFRELRFCWEANHFYE